RHEANTRLDEVEHDFLAVLARLIGKELQGAQEQRTAQFGELARATDRWDADASQRAVERAHVAFDEAPVGSVITGRDRRIQRVNRAMCTMVGRSPHELVGRIYLELLHPDDRGKSTVAMAALLGGADGPHRAERRMVHSSGRILETRVAVSAIHDADGQVEQLFAQIEDRTEINRRTRESDVAQSEILARLAAAGEFRDDDTGQHTRRVGALSAAIGARLGLPAEEVELLRVASPLHDIGKIAIPDAVLGKAGPLTRDEFELMKGHTTVGGQMLAGSSFAVLETAAEIALTHHERWDGTGYPAGVAGEEIPMSGRIVAVADVFDALTHARPYKPAWSTSAALQEMAGQGGRHFDPAVLQAFLELQTSTKGTT
ncbi:MAG: HD domain-containing protein, partial [Solirubrobacterales bacterium]|nr:HD domain-containing protein [Solirubrobacterales bacterium]